MKRSVALVIRAEHDAQRILLVQRPDDDEDLPGVWGLPAASLALHETPEDAALRAGREKLSIDLALDGVINQGARERSGYTLSMQLVAARVVGGAPDTAAAPVPAGSTRYQAWRWGAVADVRPAAERGSLCSRLLLEVSGVKFGADPA